MDKKLRELERKAAQGDKEASKQFQHLRRRIFNKKFLNFQESVAIFLIHFIPGNTLDYVKRKLRLELKLQLDLGGFNLTDFAYLCKQNLELEEIGDETFKTTNTGKRTIEWLLTRI